MNVTFRPVSKIIPYARNARKIPPEAIDKVAASIREFGWRQPIVVDREGVLICGHTRLLAAQKLGLKEAPVHVAENLTRRRCVPIACWTIALTKRPPGNRICWDWSSWI
jgi:ParB-like chromosome segregation protein Spo0J